MYTGWHWILLHSTGWCASALHLCSGLAGVSGGIKSAPIRVIYKSVCIIFNFKKIKTFKMYVGMACQKVCKEGLHGWYKSEGKYTKPHPGIFFILAYKDIGTGLCILVSQSIESTKLSILFQFVGLWLHLKDFFLSLIISNCNYSVAVNKSTEDTNTQNAKRCRDGTPKCMQTWKGWYKSEGKYIILWRHYVVVVQHFGTQITFVINEGEYLNHLWVIIVGQNLMQKYFSHHQLYILLVIFIFLVVY